MEELQTAEITEITKEDKRWCVYCHTNKINGKKYIGITSMKPEDRWNYGCGYQGSPHFWSAIKLYGWDNFEHEILFNNLSKEEACQKEIELISLYNTRNQDFGYNLAPGGSLPTFEWTDERRQKMSEQRKGWKPSEETRRKISEARTGIKLSDETKQKLREINLGKNNPNYGLRRSEETKQKMSESMIGKSKTYSDENGNPLKILICQYNKQGKLIEKFLGSYEAEQKTGVGRAAIANCLCGISKTAGGYIWKNDNEPLTEEDIILANTRKQKISHNANSIAKEYGRYQKWYDKQKQKWRVRFVSNDETSYLGTFLTEKDAENAINQHNEILMKGEEK